MLCRFFLEASCYHMMKKAQAPASNVDRTFTIKTKTLKRNITDLRYAEKEVEKETHRLEDFRSSNPDRVNPAEDGGPRGHHDGATGARPHPKIPARAS